MTYDASVRFQFSARSDLASTAIRRWTGGPFRFAHVDAETPEGHLLGARHDRPLSYTGGDYNSRLTPLGGVQLRPAGYELFTDSEVVAIPCSTAQAAAFWAALRARIGEPYSTHDIINFLLGRGGPPPASGTICSVLLWYVAQATGVLPLDVAQADWIIAPNPLYLVCRAVRAERLKEKQTC